MKPRAHLGSSSSDWEQSNGAGEILASEFMQSGEGFPCQAPSEGRVKCGQ